MSLEKNILLNQIIPDGSSFKFKETVPSGVDFLDDQYLSRTSSGEFIWVTLDLSLNVVVDHKIKDTNIYYKEGRIGIDRSPMHTYKFDLAVPKNTLMTAFHIGDGSYGFSMGNGTSQGFIPEIIGVGSDENDAGLYFVGISGNDQESNIPLILMDGRNMYGKELSKRPIFGVTSNNYQEYSLLVDNTGNLFIDGTIHTSDIYLNTNSLLEIINDLQKQIEELKTKIV